MSRFRLYTVGRPLWLLASLSLAPIGAESLRAGDPIIAPSQLAATQIKGAAASPNQGECRLNFIRKDWGDVLNQVAKETQSTLVMPETPPGKFSRTDFGKHSREEAIRILNRDLEKLGYRLAGKDEFLEVIPVKRTHPEFERHNVLTDADRQAAKSQADAAEAAATARIAGTTTAAPAAKNMIQQAQHEVPAEAAAPGAAALTIQPRNRPALDIAKQVHVTFKQRARLENNGPHGLPAFIVDHFAPEAVKAGRPLFILEIDTASNQLLITAERGVQQGLQQLCAKLDVNPLGVEPLPKMMAGNGTTAETGQKLVQPLSLIAQVRQQQPDADAPPLPPMNPAAAPATPGPAPSAGNAPPAGNAPAAGAGLTALLGNLRGDVSIEALGDLDLLILRGNEKDVEAVMQVIQAIERMAVGSLPEIHLLRLRFVDSQSLAQLLNDVYTRMTELRSNNAQQNQVAVRAVPVVIPNAVLLLAPASAMQAVLDLAEELDQPVDPSHEVQIFRLKYAVAASVVELLNNFYTQPPAGLGTRLKVAADARTNSVIVQANPRDLSEVAEFIKGVDSEQASSVNRLRVFQLKSSSAEEMAAFLNNAIQSTLNPARMTATTGQAGAGAATTATGTQQVRATVLEFLAEGGQALIRSGLLNDIRFNADPRTNSLLVTAPEQSMPLVEELIRILDRPSSALAEIKVYPLTNADATNAVDLLRELFNVSTTQTQNQAANQPAALNVELLGAQGTGSNLVPLRFSTDARTNSVVAIGGAEALRIVEAILLRLDSNNARNRQTTVIKLRNSPVADVAAAINEFLQAQRELATLDPNRISTSQLLEQEIIVTAEPVTNSLLISATPSYFKQLEEIAKKLDAEPPQVVIQAMLVEVTLDNTDEFGVELGFQDPVLFSRSLIDTIQTITQTTQTSAGQVANTTIVSQNATPGFNFNNQPLGSNNSQASNNNTVGTQGLTNFSMGRVNNDLGYGGLVLSASSDAVSVLIRALAARRTLRVLSRPQIISLDNQTAQIQVGQVVPVPNGVTITNGLATTAVLRDAAGIILTVSPRISPEGQIVMEVAAEKSQYANVNTGVPIFTDAATGAVVTSPIKDITTARTTVKVPDGQTIVVGGMITKTDQNAERKVPWLGDLPIIGKVFRYDLFEYKRTELLIFLTPRIVRSDADMEMIKQVETGRMHFFQDDVESIHGPIFGVPRAGISPIEALPPVEIIRPKESVPTTPPVPPAPSLPAAPGRINPSSAKSLRQEGGSENVYRIGDLPVE